MQNTGQSEKRWRVIVHLKTEMGAQSMEMAVDRFSEIDAALGDGAGHVISAHVVPTGSRAAALSSGPTKH